MKLNFCVACGIKENLHYHHLIPKIHGGSDEETNLITLCENCHGAYHNKKFKNHGALTRKALQDRKRNGKVYNGQLPYGFDRDGDDMIKNASEQAVIADIVTRRNEGATLTSIADELNERGLQGKAGGKWYASTVKNVITYQKTL
tara:strand:- start:24845 stop:25279 length:435 start_codon:yes stop_codon:yes gene_type:complete